MGRYSDLKVWKAAHGLTLDIYRATAIFPNSELYGLTSQIRRASASIGANLAEGSGRRSRAELARFASIAAGSANELEYHLLLSKDLGYISQEVYAQLSSRLADVGRMLNRLVDSLRSRATNSSVDMPERAVTGNG